MNLNREKINNTVISDYPNSELRFRLVYPTGKKQSHEEYFDSYKQGESKFDELVEDGVNEVKYFIALVDSKGHLVDQELIVSHNNYEYE